MRKIFRRDRRTSRQRNSQKVYALNTGAISGFGRQELSGLWPDFRRIWLISVVQHGVAVSQSFRHAVATSAPNE